MTKLGSNNEIGELLKRIKQETELSYVKQASERYSQEFDKIADDLLDFSSSSFTNPEEHKNLSVEQLISELINFLTNALNRTEKISLQLREWYAAHTPEAPHIMHIPLHPAHDYSLHPEALRRLGADFNNFQDYDNFLKNVRNQIDICKNCKCLLEEQKHYIENSDLSYIDIQLDIPEKEILLQTLKDYKPAIENILIHYQNFGDKLPGNLYAEGGFIGHAFSKSNIAALELYRIKKILTLIREGMSSDHLYLYQKVFESQVRLNKLLNKAIAKHGIDSTQAKLYSAQAEAARLAKRYIEEVHQLTKSKLTVDIKEVATWFTKGKINENHPLHKDNPDNILTNIKHDFLSSTNIERIQSLYQGANPRYLNAIKKISNKQKLIEKYINFHRDNNIDELEIVKTLVNLHQNGGRLSKRIDTKIVREALQNIGISSSYLDEIQTEILRVTRMNNELCFNKVIDSLLNLDPNIDEEKFKQLLAIWLNANYFPINEQGFQIHTSFFTEAFSRNGIAKYAIDFFENEFIHQESDNLDIEDIQKIIAKFESNHGPNADYNRIIEIVVKVCFLSTRLNSLNIYNQVTKKRFQYHDLFFSEGGKTTEQVRAWNSYRYLSWAQNIAEDFNKNDDKMLWLLLSKKLNIKTCFKCLKYLSRLNHSRNMLIKDLTRFSSNDGSSHLFDIETAYFENFKNESNISAVLCRGGSYFDVQAMDIICEIIQIQYADIVNYKHKNFAQRIDRIIDSESGFSKTNIKYFNDHITSHKQSLKSNSGAHRLSRQLYYALWGVRSGLYYNLNFLKEKDIVILLRQFKHLMELGDILEILVAETAHDQWFGNIYEHYPIKLLEMKWFQKASLLNGYFRRSSQVREALDLFSFLDKDYQFIEEEVNQLLLEFKSLFNIEYQGEETLKFDFNRDSRLNSIDFSYIYKTLCYRFDDLEVSKDPFFQTLVFNLFNLENLEYFHEQKFKLSRFNQVKRDKFGIISEFYRNLSIKLDQLARKIQSSVYPEKYRNIDSLFKRISNLLSQYEKDLNSQTQLEIDRAIQEYL